jgi:hypothetical protein
MEKLIPMVEYVLEQYETIQQSNVFENNCYNYANLLKQPLTLSMFVPCDDDGNVLEYENDQQKYQKAKEKVIFEGFTYKKALFLNYTFFSYGKFEGETIEDLIHYNLELNQNNKQIQEL